jgi:hypothetical protein
MHHRGKARFALHGVDWDMPPTTIIFLALSSVEGNLSLAKPGATTLPR